MSPDAAPPPAEHRGRASLSGWDAIDSPNGSGLTLTEIRPGREAAKVLDMLRAVIAQHVAESVARMVDDSSPWPAAAAVEAALAFWIDLAHDAAKAGAEHALATIAEPVAA